MNDIDRRHAMKQIAVAATLPFGTLAHAQEPKKTTEPAPKVDPYSDAKLVDAEPPAIADGSFTIAVLPDTQYYSEKFPKTFLAQTQYILDEQKKRNIVATLHLGDITNRNTVSEWKNAAAAMKQLDGHIPWFFCPGNHDYSVGGGCKDRTTLLDEYFPTAMFKNRPTFGGTYDKEPERMHNNFAKFSTAGRDFLVLALEFGPRKDVIRWANDVVKQHPKHEVILITHAYMYSDETRYDFKKNGTKQSWNPHVYALAKATDDDVTDGEELWAQLVSKHENFILTLNGHVINDGLGRTVTATAGGRKIPQILVNFQMKPNGGDGWLRLLEFKKDGKTVDVWDYSPTLKKRNESAQNRFQFETAKPIV